MFRFRIFRLSVFAVVLVLIVACGKLPTGLQSAEPTPQSEGEQPAVEQQLALPNGQVIDRPTDPITLDNVKSLDALALWQLPGQVSQMLIAPDGLTVYAAVGTPLTSAKGMLYTWRLDQNSEPQVLLETQGAINSLFFSPDNRYLVYGTQGNELVLYDLQTNTAGENLLNTGRGVTSAAWSPAEDLLAWGLFEDYEYYQYLNGSQTGKFGYRLGTTLDMEFSPDGKEIAMAREDGSLFIVDASGWQLLKSIPAAKAGRERLGWLGLSPDGSQMAITGEKLGTMWVVDSASWEPVVTLQADLGLHKGAFSKDGQMLLVGNDNNSVSILSLPIRNFTGALKLADSPVLSVAISPDGALLMIGDRNGQVRLLAPQSMVNLEALPGASATPAP